MKVTVCQLHDEVEDFERDWDALVAHARREASELVLLPEMPFAPWFGVSHTFDDAVWNRVVDAHERWLDRLRDLAPSQVLCTRPVNRNGHRLNEAFAWSATDGYQPAHQKCYLPEEEGFWEASWYDRGDGEFAPVRVGPATVGFMICTELWSLGHAQRYGKSGAHLIATPRASGRTSVEKWVTGGRAAAIVSGAYSISSNRTARNGDFGGGGWIVDPDGVVLAVTTREEPIRSIEIDLVLAESAKATYPRYALD
jgi:N-carbamoylputrescine amidase